MDLKYTYIIVLLFAAGFCNAQPTYLDVDFEFQAYPTGLIPGVRLETGKGKNAAHLRLGYNWIRHGDFGKHEDERGDGFGFSIGYKRYFKPEQKGLFAGLKNDIWFNEIDWKDDIGAPNERSGRTKITVLQPTAEFGYAFVLNPSLVISPNIAVGYEINAKTNGEPTGEGAIFLMGVCIGKRFIFTK